MNFINQLKIEKVSLLKRVEAIDVLLDSYNVNNADKELNTSNDSDFPKKGTMVEQISYIIKTADKFLHNSEITNALEPYYNKDSILKRRVSVSNSKAKTSGGNLTSIQIGASKRNIFWGSKKWLDEEGIPFNQHLYDKNLVVIRKNKEINI